VDRRGVHVVVGHYLGDTSSAGHPPNLTDGKNIFLIFAITNKTIYDKFS
jgi:hypothetical protein